MKACTKCKEVKSETEYHTANGKRVSICKVCKNEQSCQYRKNRNTHQKKMLYDYYTKYCEENAERIKQNKQKYYQANREVFCERARKYREDTKCSR